MKGGDTFKKFLGKADYDEFLLVPFERFLNLPFGKYHNKELAVTELTSL